MSQFHERGNFVKEDTSLLVVSEKEAYGETLNLIVLGPYVPFNFYQRRVK